MKKLFIIFIGLLVISCAQKQSLMNKDEVVAYGFQRFISSTEYVNVVYEEHGEEKRIYELQLKFKNKQGFGNP